MIQLSLFVSVFLGIGIFFILYEVCFHYFKLRNWLSVEGEIINSDINQIEAAYYPWDPIDFSSKATRKVLIKAVIKYQYKVGTQTYHNDQAILDKVYDVNQDVAQEEVDERSEKYVKGKTIIVFYNPKNPSESFLSDKEKITDKYSDHFAFIFLIGILIIGFTYIKI